MQRPLLYALPAVAILIIALVASYLGGPSPAMSAPTEGGWPQIKLYLRVDGIEGECTGELHKGCMEVLMYQQAVDVWADPHVCEGGSVNERRGFELTVTRPVNKVSPLLFAHCCQEVRIPRIVLELWYEGATSQKVMTYTGNDCTISVIRNTKALTADGVPTEELTFACASMEWTCPDYDTAGQSVGEVHALCGSLRGR